MARPRIIIADTDINYIVPIQLKFVEEFFEKVDLEIISDGQYFEELFSSPQTANILIVSEELYGESLKRHNIGNIFLMTEQYDEGQTDDLNINQIFKYTSIKEIFNEIIGKSVNVLNIQSEGKSEPKILMVYSASGGTGKTTVAMGLAVCLTKNYKRVLYINAERLQSFQRLLDNPTPIAASDIYAKLGKPTRNIYSDISHVIRREIFSYLPPFKSALMSLGLEYSVFSQIAGAAKKSSDYDFIIVDADSSFDEEKARMMDAADKVIIVTDQTYAAVYAANTLAANINGMNTDKYVFLCNNFDKERDNALIASNITMRFSVSEYIDHIPHYDRLRCADLGKCNGMQRTAFLIM